jgi:cyclopropane fatty-acyl-phospholipid synthase-like methyltransferase
MNKEYFEIKDNCRNGLLKYLAKAISIIPIIENPRILDVGCGSGVPTLMIAEKFNGKITAIDSDTKSMDILREKVKKLNLSNRVTLSNSSLFDNDNKVKNNQYDLIITEGLLNVVGFQKGFLRILKLLKRNGFIIIHDEFRNQNKKIEFIENNNCKILDSFVLDEQIWWNDYFKCLEKEIFANSNKEISKLFKSDLDEIESFKKDSSQYNSVYYVIEKF